jgi:hypothetical protein
MVFFAVRQHMREKPQLYGMNACLFGGRRTY